MRVNTEIALIAYLWRAVAGFPAIHLSFCRGRVRRICAHTPHIELKERARELCRSHTDKRKHPAAAE